MTTTMAIKAFVVSKKAASAFSEQNHKEMMRREPQKETYSLRKEEGKKAILL
jgi:hypothetical protein